MSNYFPAVSKITQLTIIIFCFLQERNLCHFLGSFGLFCARFFFQTFVGKNEVVYVLGFIIVYALVFHQRRYKNQENTTLPTRRVFEICSSSQFLEETACKLLSLPNPFPKTLARKSVFSASIYLHWHTK